MIIENGTIELKQKTEAGGIDPVTGYPLPPSEIVWSEPIPCQFVVNKIDNLGSVNGEPTKVAKYTILIDDRPFDSEQLRLKDRAGGIVGEFSIIQVEQLEAVAQIRLLV